MICEKCGAVIEDGHIMCPKCGALVTIGTKNNYGINWDTEPANKVSDPFFELQDKEVKEDIEDTEVDIVEDIEGIKTDEEIDKYEKHIPVRLICLFVIAIIVTVGAILKGKSFFEEREEKAFVNHIYENEWAYENMEESDGRIRYYSFNNGIYDSNGKMYCSKANIDDQKITVLFNYSNTRCRYIDFSDSKDGESGILYIGADGEKSKIAENVCEIYGTGLFGEKDSYYLTKDGEVYSYDDKTCKSTLRYENVMTMAVDELGDSVAYLCENEGEYVVNYTDEDTVIEIIRGEKKLAPFGISKRYHGNYIFLRDMDNGEIYRFSFSTKQLEDLEINAPKMSDAVFNKTTKWLLVNSNGSLYWCKPDTEPSILATNFENRDYANYLVNGFVCTLVVDDKSIFQYRLEVSGDQYYLNLEQVSDHYVIEDHVVESDGDVVFLSEDSLYWSRYASSDPVEILSDVKALYPDEGSFNNYTAVVLTEDDEYYLWVDGQLIKLDKSPF